MTDAALTELQSLRREFAALVANLSPYIGRDEMQSRYGVGTATLLAMERRKEIPLRHLGRWVRTEVLQWESARNMHGNR